MIIILTETPHNPWFANHLSLSFANAPFRFRAVAPLPFDAPAAVT